MAGGGGTQKTVAEPWVGAQPFLSQGFSMARQAAGTPPEFYPGRTFAGPQAGQMAGWDAQLGYADQVFGGQNPLRFGDVTGSVQKQLTGNNPLSSFVGQLAPSAASQLKSGLGPFGTAGSLDARGAITSALSGKPDYAGLNGAIEAANAPLLRQFNEELIPGLNQRTLFTQNPTGAIKSLNTALPQLADRMSENALSLTNDERIRALTARDNAASLVANGGLNMGQQALNFGNLYGNLAGASGDASMRAAAMFPALFQTGQIPGQLATQFGDWAAQFPAAQTAENVDRWNFGQNQARDNATWFINAINGMGGLGGTSTTSGGGGGLGGALAGGAGGALAGGAIAKMLPAAMGITGPIGMGIGAGLGLLGSIL